jgi:hypothetical protein
MRKGIIYSLTGITSGVVKKHQVGELVASLPKTGLNG